MMNRFAAPFGKIEKKVVFESFRGRAYSDNPRAISEKLHELYPDYTIVWGFFDEEHSNRQGVPDYVRSYFTGSKEFRKERATAFAYIRNEEMTEELYKRKGQVYIQTWHADRGFKKILYDRYKPGKNRGKVMDGVITDLFITGSGFAEKRIVTAFDYHGPVLPCGSPRNDCLIHPANTEKIRASLGIGNETKILLYAPTLRREKVVKGTLDIDETLKALDKRGGDWICLVRAHPKSLGLDIQKAERMIDVSGYPDMADLLMIADMLITDYSSSAGDFILTGKPVILEQFDRSEYLKQRDFCVDFDEAGFAVAESQEELDHLLETETDEQFAARDKKALDYFKTYENGHAAEDVCRWIDEQYKKRHENH